ncbi:hypothetical protein Hsw_1761 [Hymenobacter swuensis DY53]|uniref:Uncharacterized protein n=1 Tax=Hymenobacter swuensis DY53 TaxID=1227739 RepID=W8F441_9BACT|nr:hypothetical protein Hsw_1761 [Hymenobacter swuensis DY53]
MVDLTGAFERPGSAVAGPRAEKSAVGRPREVILLPGATQPLPRVLAVPAWQRTPILLF